MASSGEREKGGGQDRGRGLRDTNGSVCSKPTTEFIVQLKEIPSYYCVTNVNGVIYKKLDHYAVHLEMI